MISNISLLTPKRILRESSATARALRSLALSLIALVAASCGSRTREATPSATPSVTPLPVAELLRRADEQYAARADLGQVREGLKTIRRIRAVEFDNYEAAWRAARLDYTLGDRSDDDREREQAFTDGMESGETATRVEPNRAEGHFWLGANYGGYAEFKGVLYGITYTVKLRREMEAVIKIDPSFEAGSAYLGLGQLDRELPEMLGGDPQRAVKTLEDGLKYGENNALLRLELAQAYLATKRKDDARRELTWVVNSKPDPNHLPEHEEAVKTARELLAKNF
ncbi:MAG: tetratricopeptide repeat protein [Acidobacteria bacterium]|nr:tetratricopeptide repeat protein [Acidobacteriota bacterium]